MVEFLALVFFLEFCAVSCCFREFLGFLVPCVLSPFVRLEKQLMLVAFVCVLGALECLLSGGLLCR